MRLNLILILLAVPVASAAPLLASPHTVACFLDANGDGARGGLEPVYLQVAACAGGARAADVRLSDGIAPGGTIVTGLDDDTSRTHLPVPAAGYAFADDDGNGVQSGSDPLYLHLGALPGNLAPGDIPLTGNDAFRPLSGSDSRIGTPVAAAPVAIGAESYSETDGNPGFTVGDVLYLDFDGNAQTTIGDLRLAFGVAPAASPSSAAPSSNPATGMATSRGLASTSAEAPATQTRPSTSQGAAGVSSPLFLLGIGAALVVRRR